MTTQVNSFNSSKINDRDRIRAERIWNEMLDLGYAIHPGQSNKLYFTKLERVVFGEKTYFRQKLVGGQWQIVGISKIYR
jgi:hypothetical protein